MEWKKIREDAVILVIVVCFLWFLVFLVRSRTVADAWFPVPVAALAFKVLFCAWILAEIANSLWSRKNTVASSLDKGSFRVVVLSHFAVLFIIFACRSFQVAVLTGPLQYAGLALIAAGILFREWAIAILGNRFTVRVQVAGTQRLVTRGPYRYIRHPSYTGTLMTLTGLALAVGTWLAAIIVVILSLAAYEYRIRVEEEALRNAFGKEFEEYKKRTGKLFPKF